MDPSPFFDYARERYQILLRRRAGQTVSLGQHTDDWILQTYRFCNIFREDDTTTIWLREHVREQVSVEEILLATVIFRWFNRIRTGEAIFQQKDLLGGDTAWFMMMVELEMNNWEVQQGHGCSAMDPLRSAIGQYCGEGPYVTGSYIIKTPDGRSKLDGVLWCIEQFLSRDQPALYDSYKSSFNWKQMTAQCLSSADTALPLSLQTVWQWLRQFPYMGDFMAYEVVTDLRHTPLLDRAPDIATWANPGPGAMRGLNRLHGRDLKFRQPKEQFIEEMRSLLFLSEDRILWPGEWPSWEMREVEHTLCEFDKYERVRLGQGEPRQKYRGGL